VVEVDGPYGPELLLPDGRRVVGVDGPRWFLRVVAIAGDRRIVRPAAGAGSPGSGAAGRTAGGSAAAVEAILRRLVVVRGSAAMPPRTALPLRPPAATDLRTDGDTPSGILLDSVGPADVGPDDVVGLDGIGTDGPDDIGADHRDGSDTAEVSAVEADAVKADGVRFGITTVRPTGTGTVQCRPAVYELSGPFTGGLSRDLTTWG